MLKPESFQKNKMHKNLLDFCYKRIPQTQPESQT